MGKLVFMSLFFLCATMAVAAEQKFESDTIKTSRGDLVLTFVGHGTIMMSLNGKVIHVDPVSQMADYTKMPKADLILITHEHSDHFDLKAITLIKTAKTKIVATETVARQISDAIIMKNGDIRTIEGLRIEAVPAYNLVNMRSPGNPFHPKGIGNGYIIDLRRQTCIYCRGYGKHAGNEKLKRDRYCVFTHESSLYDDSGNGSRRGKGFPSPDTLSLSLRKYGHGKAD